MVADHVTKIRKARVTITGAVAAFTMSVDAVTPRDRRLAALCALLREFEPDVAITDNVAGYLWSKLVFTP